MGKNKVPELTTLSNDGPLKLIGIGETEATEVAVLSNDEVKEQEEALRREEAAQREKERLEKAKKEAERQWQTFDWSSTLELANCNEDELAYMHDILKIKLNLSEEGEAAQEQEEALKAENEKLLAESDW
jgi:hypothetical protein